MTSTTEVPRNELRFTRTEAGRYHAAGAAHTYTITRDDKRWMLRIYPLSIARGPIQIDTHDTLSDAKATVAAFEALGATQYLMADHGGRNRYTEAVRRAYSPTAKCAQVDVIREGL